MLALGIVIAGAQAASAHDSLTGSTPADGDSVSVLTEVSQTFSENLLDVGQGNIAEVIGPDGLHYESGCTALTGPTITTPVALGAAGDYEVVWRAVSSDGHPIADSYTFVYAPDDGAEGAEGTTASACTTSPVGAATEPEATEPDAIAEQGSGVQLSGLAIGLAIGGVVIAGLAVAVVVIVRSRRS
jgi:hypothetical protein